MAYTTIDDPSVYFQTLLYTGNATGSRALTNDGNSDLQPDWVWIKERSSTSAHKLLDSTRGVGKALGSNTTNEEESFAFLSSFDSDGFTIGTSDGSTNANGDTYVAWQWKANGGSRTTFTESGANPGGGYQANTTAGFSIIDYTGTGSAGTVAHGLGVVPHMYMTKSRSDGSTNWIIYHQGNSSTPENDYIQFNTSGKGSHSSAWNNTAPTSSVITLGNSDEVCKDSTTYIMYAFAEKQGYSKFGSYTGNGNANGTFVYTGFKPAWCMWKRTDGGTNMWMIMDTKRDTSNVMDKYLAANSNAVEADYDFVDFLSNGFKFRHTSSHANGDGESYIYMAFAENPFVSSKGTPTTAR